jgi:hypothetical protein
MAAHWTTPGSSPPNFLGDPEGIAMASTLPPAVKNSAIAAHAVRRNFPITAPIAPIFHPAPNPLDGWNTVPTMRIGLIWTNCKEAEVKVKVQVEGKRKGAGNLHELPWNIGEKWPE